MFHSTLKTVAESGAVQPQKKIRGGGDKN